MREKILIVEDEKNIVDVLSRYLHLEGFQVVPSYDGSQALLQWKETQPDLVILDLMLPRTDGLTVAETMREQSDIPIIMLTAKSQPHDRIMGLTIGADDYVPKPFSPKEVVLRVKNVLGRMSGASSENRSESVLQYGNLSIDVSRREVKRNEEILTLTAKEFDLLHLLAASPGQVFSRQQLLQKIWGTDFFGDVNTVNVHIRKIREKIEEDPSQPQTVKTVWGIGYKFEESQT